MSTRLRVNRGGERLEFSLKPNISESRGKKTKLIGVYSGGEWKAPKYVETESKGILAHSLLHTTGQLIQ